jgi:hypothetical protein
MTKETFKDSPPMQQEYLQYLKLLQLANLPDDPTLQDWILHPFLPIFSALPQLPLASYTLQDYFSAETLSYTFRVARGERIPVLCDRPPFRMQMGVPLSPEDYSEFPVFLPAQVEIGSNFDDRPTKVRINKNTDCYFKHLDPGDEQVLQNELKTYRHIQEAGSLLNGDNNNVHISCLYGLVQDDSDSSIIGLLLSFIDCGCIILLCVVESDTPKALHK